jgi:regulator of replication initiation timing
MRTAHARSVLGVEKGAADELSKRTSGPRASGQAASRVRKLQAVIPALVEEAAVARRDAARLRLENAKLRRQLGESQLESLRRSAEVMMRYRDGVRRG